jgi:very-short-patch-repair endonuclease
VPSLLRGAHAVVAGDRQQLPPTNFFLAGDDEESESEVASPTQGFESVLDVLSSFLEPWTLDWHYRSRDEALIAFSNHHIYSDRLVTFPGPGTESVIEHVLVAHVPGQDGQEESSSPEVRRVVELILKHAADRPQETLGVIALGIPHKRRLEAAVEEARRSRPDLDAFFSEARQERFFVKNLERVQGDERDAIILSVGYGKDRSGRLLYSSLGPLVRQGAERRINVAITRARKRMTVVSSFSHHDMDPNRSQARGVELLRLYLEYAASRGKHLGQERRSEFQVNAFEQDVADALSVKGVSLLPQWGASHYRIDLVAQHPRRPGRFVLAIECDGATYHSAQTARDRDRLRQQHLEALGWRFLRIWSTDWFLRREEEIARAYAAYEAAVAEADRRDAEGTDCEPARQDCRTATTAQALQSATPVRTDRPSIGRRPAITDYANQELVQMVRWLQSDGRLRTDEELLEEMIEELGFERRGSRIAEVILRAIEAARATRRSR